jgi:hypothetical protein
MHITVLLGIFTSTFTSLAVLLSVAQSLAASFSNNVMTAGAAILGIIIGFILFKFLLPRLVKDHVRYGFWLIYLFGAIGGIGYSFLKVPPACIFTGMAAYGLLLFLAPTKIGNWTRHLFGPETNKKFLVGISVSLACVFYSVFYLTDLVMQSTTVLSVCLFVIWVWWLVWPYVGKALTIPIVFYDISPPEPLEHPPVSKLVVNLVTVLGWNFLFLMLVEFWYWFLTPNSLDFNQYAINVAIPPAEFGSLLVAIAIGTAIMAVHGTLFKQNEFRSTILYLIGLVTFFVFTELYFFNPAGGTTQADGIYMFIALLALPMAIAGVFECSPFEFKNKLIDLLESVLVILVLVIAVGSRMVFPNLLAAYGHDTIFPTFYLLNILFIGFLFLFNILRLGMTEKPIENEQVVETIKEE